MSLIRYNSETSEGKIPAFLNIDVEPDTFQLSRADPPKWTGYEAMFEFTKSLRLKLTEGSGETPTFGWYFRTDPQIADVYGRPDYALTEFPDRTTRLQEKGDYFGVHSHPLRWSDGRRMWIHDFGNTTCCVNSTRFSLDAYSEWNGAPAQRFRSGAGFLTNEIVRTADQFGVKVDLTLEPVAASRTSWAKLSLPDISLPGGVHSDCVSAPRGAYRPSMNDFRVPDQKTGRDLILIPLATYTSTRWKSLLRKTAFRLLSRYQKDAGVLYLSGQWPSSTFYWNLVTQQILSMPHPYLSLAVRTDPPGSVSATRVRTLLYALLEHPLVERLQFIDPLDVACRLL